MELISADLWMVWVTKFEPAQTGNQTIHLRVCLKSAHLIEVLWSLGARDSETGHMLSVRKREAKHFL